jgi:hypothetical protein
MEVKAVTGATVIWRGNLFSKLPVITHRVITGRLRAPWKGLLGKLRVVDADGRCNSTLPDAPHQTTTESAQERGIACHRKLSLSAQRRLDSQPEWLIALLEGLATQDHGPRLLEYLRDNYPKVHGYDVPLLLCCCCCC